MTERTERDDLDRRLDAALDSYADPGPDSGLERRVLRRIDTARKRTRRLRRTLLWGGGLAAVAAGVLFLLVLPARWQHTPPHTAPKIGTSATPALSARAATAEAPRPARRLASQRERTAGRATAQPAALPKLDVFPTPAPLSDEERALVRLATETSVKQRNDLVAAQQQSAEPLRISAISIPPIEPPTEGKE